MSKTVSEKALDNLIEVLIDIGCEVPCETMPNDGWCDEHCRYSSPQKECWERWAKVKE